MERDLNFKKLIKMLVLNMGLMILGGCICAAGLIFFSSVSQNYTMVKKVYLVYDMEKPAEEDLTVRKNNYFDAYQNLYRSKFSWTSDDFSEEEKSRFSHVSVEVSSCMYTLTVTLPDGDNLERDEASFDKLVQESELWMKEKFMDDSLSVEVLSEETIVNQIGTSTVVKAILGFIVGAILVAIALFIVFVTDRKIRTNDDVKYYMGIDCLSVIDGKNSIDNLREFVLLSDAQIWGITGIKQHPSKTMIAQTLFERLGAAGINTLYLSFEPYVDNNNITDEVELSKIVPEDLKDVQKIRISDCSQVEKLVYSNAFEEKLKMLGERYERIIVDAVALDENSISKKVCSLCDETLLVVADGEVNGEETADYVSQLSKLKVKVTGVVLSKINIKRKIIRF